MDTTVYVHTARDLGRTIDSKGRAHYWVGNGLVQVELHPIEYTVWKNSARMDSISKWREDSSELIKSRTKVSMDTIEQRLLSNRLLHSLEFENEYDEGLVNIFVIRNGFSYGERGGIWVIAPHDNKTKLRLTREEFDIWIQASSYKSLLEIVVDVVKKKGYAIEQAIKVVSEISRKFIRVELWTAEYLPEGDS